MSAFTLYSQEMMIARLHHNCSIRFVSLKSAPVPLYVTALNSVCSILHKILAWHIAVSITVLMYTHILTCCATDYKNVIITWPSTTDISVCHAYIVALTYSLTTKCEQPFHRIDQYWHGIGLVLQWHFYSTVVLVANIYRGPCQIDM